jgi:hypothetical protein
VLTRGIVYGYFVDFQKSRATTCCTFVQHTFVQVIDLYLQKSVTLDALNSSGMTPPLVATVNMNSYGFVRLLKPVRMLAFATKMDVISERCSGFIGTHRRGTLRALRARTIMILQIILNMLTVIGVVSSVWFLRDKLHKLARLNWRQLEERVLGMVETMRREDFSPTLICDVGPGGAILGALVSGAVGHRPLVVIDIQYQWQDGRRQETVFGNVRPQANLDRVLLIEGAVYSGNTIRLCHDPFEGARRENRQTSDTLQPAWLYRTR